MCSVTYLCLLASRASENDWRVLAGVALANFERGSRGGLACKVDEEANDAGMPVFSEKRVCSEASPGRIGHEKRVNYNDEHILPRPFARMQVKSKPQVKREQSSEQGEKSDPDTQYQRNRE